MNIQFVALKVFAQISAATGGGWSDFPQSIAQTIAVDNFSKMLITLYP